MRTMFSANDSSRNASSQAKAYRGTTSGTLVMIIDANADRRSPTCGEARHGIAVFTQRHILSNTIANLNPNVIISHKASISVSVAKAASIPIESRIPGLSQSQDLMHGFGQVLKRFPLECWTYFLRRFKPTEFIPTETPVVQFRVEVITEEGVVLIIPRQRPTGYFARPLGMVSFCLPHHHIRIVIALPKHATGDIAVSHLDHEVVHDTLMVNSMRAGRGHHFPLGQHEFEHPQAERVQISLRRLLVGVLMGSRCISHQVLSVVNSGNNSFKTLRNGIGDGDMEPTHEMRESNGRQ
ncbi:hypothetical protein MHU86_16582 [Fragilaria crotonensis]|nr:hypothetical protein MHU86_16582 [Fragilaria crotonensis]